MSKTTQTSKYLNEMKNVRDKIELTLGMVSHCAIRALCGERAMVALRPPGVASCRTRSYSPLVSKQRLCLSYTISSLPYSLLHLLSVLGSDVDFRRFVTGSVEWI